MTQIPAAIDTLEIEKAGSKLRAARAEIGKVVFGQQKIVDQTLISLISGGHVLLIGVPGLAKTLLVQTVAKVMGLSNARLQCTPDLMRCCTSIFRQKRSMNIETSDGWKVYHSRLKKFSKCNNHNNVW